MDFLTRLHQEIFRSPREQRADLEIVSTDPLAVEAGSLENLLRPVAEDLRFKPVAKEGDAPITSWGEISGDFWLARAAETTQYVRVASERPFCPGRHVERFSVEPAGLEYMEGPAARAHVSP